MSSTARKSSRRERLIEWAEECGHKPADIIKKTGLKQSTIYSIFSGQTKRVLGETEAIIAAAYGLRVEDIFGSHEPPTLNYTGVSESPPAIEAPMIPVYTGMGGDMERIILTGESIDYIDRPPELVGVRDAFAIHVMGESMVPVYKPGTILLVHPNKQPRKGQGCVVDTPMGGRVKEYIRRDPMNIYLREYTPARDFSIPAHEVQSIHTVIGTREG